MVSLTMGFNRTGPAYAGKMSGSKNLRRTRLHDRSGELGLRQMEHQVMGGTTPPAPVYGLNGRHRVAVLLNHANEEDIR